MARAQVGLEQVFKLVLLCVLFLTAYGWYLMFGLYIAILYTVGIVVLMSAYYKVTY